MALTADVTSDVSVMVNWCLQPVCCMMEVGQGQSSKPVFHEIFPHTCLVPGLQFKLQTEDPSLFLYRQVLLTLRQQQGWPKCACSTVPSQTEFSKASVH